MKDQLNCSYNGGGIVYLLKSVAIYFNLTVRVICPDCVVTDNGEHPYIPTGVCW